jgi:hypothetical protein
VKAAPFFAKFDVASDKVLKARFTFYNRQPQAANAIANLPSQGAAMGLVTTLVDFCNGRGYKTAI